MSFLSGSGLPEPTHTQSLMAAYCASIPGAYLSANDLPGAAGALAHVLQVSGGGLIPRSEKDLTPDAMANLWFMRAAHLFGAAGGEAEFFRQTLLPFCKKIVQEFITTAGVGGVIMDDGGLLVPPAAVPGDASPALSSRWELRLNALWYSAVETTGVNLKAVGDRAGDHFERLAGRFRRSFAKSFWCDEHGSVCGADARKLEGHGELPDADQLLLTVLPESPIPRTKQRQILQVVRAKALGAVGVFILHPLYGKVESVVHRAWLVSGLLSSADARNTAIPEATEMAAPLFALSGGAASLGIPALYKDGKPLEGLGADTLTTAEVRAAIELLRGS